MFRSLAPLSFKQFSVKFVFYGQIHLFAIWCQFKLSSTQFVVPITDDVKMNTNTDCRNTKCNQY